MLVPRGAVHGARALADPLLKPSLENIDVARLKAHRYAFISQAIGGPRQCSGPSLAAAPAQLRIEERHFDAFVEHLSSVLIEDVGAPQDVVAEILSRVTPLPPVVVNAAATAR